ncbi:MAG: tetratricopeptide repeat protein [Polyangiaceae bacterium]
MWEVARAPSLAKYCDLLARAQAQLASAPEQAKATALEADAVVGGRAAPAVVVARAALALGDAEEAAKSFATARARDARSVEEPNALYDLARTLRATGKLDEALHSYRALVPRLDLLSTTERKVGALLEAAHVAMAAPASAEAPAARADEAAAWLREARQRP